VQADRQKKVAKRQKEVVQGCPDEKLPDARQGTAVTKANGTHVYCIEAEGGQGTSNLKATVNRRIEKKFIEALI